ncbi:MAG: DUF624 domain-containing protein [Clostridia bacterium]|nr:DUF624 domain-containing protein [Clostridia bacterium]
MGLFNFNYDKPGPGVPENLPPKKGIALFFDILTRKFSNLVKINLLYVLCSLPVFAVYFIFGTIYLNIVVSSVEELGANAFLLCIVISIFIMLMLGGGVLTPGFVYVLRCFVRGEHAFLASDFFEHIKKNLKQSVVVMIIDFIFIYLLLINFNIFTQVPQLNVFRIPIYLVAILYCISRMYLYLLMVTFKASLWSLYKHSFIFCFARLPQNLLLLVLSVAIYLAIAFLIPSLLVVFVVAILILFSLLWTMQMVYTYSVVEKLTGIGQSKEKTERIFED